jgi:hypothetical protein
MEDKLMQVIHEYKMDMLAVFNEQLLAEPR